VKHRIWKTPEHPGIQHRILKRDGIILGAAVLLFAVLAGGCAINPNTLAVQPLQLNEGAFLINELSYSNEKDLVIVPGGNTGNVFLINAKEHSGKPIHIKEFVPGPNGGIISAVIGGEVLFAADRNSQKLYAIDPGSEQVLVSQPLLAAPEYIRFIRNTRTGDSEIWVTEPGQHQIEILVYSGGDAPTLTSTKPVPVEGGPVGLIFDSASGIVYTNQPDIGLTSGYNALSRELQAKKSWGNGCTRARGLGLALSGSRQVLLITCEEGKLVVLDLKTGIQVMNYLFGKELNQVSYDPRTENIFLPSGYNAIMGVLKMAEPTPVPTPTTSFLDFILPADTTPTPTEAPYQYTAPTGTEEPVLVQIASADTADDASCITIDKYGQAWICDPKHGGVLLVESGTADGDQ
jgi:hypothetical protein